MPLKINCILLFVGEEIMYYKDQQQSLPLEDSSWDLWWEFFSPDKKLKNLLIKKM